MIKNEIKIANTKVNCNELPYVIAEAGSNFNQNIDTAKELINVAAGAGANAVKFQLFRADLLYPNGGELYDIFKSIELNPEWVPILEQHCREQNIHFLASAFDKYSIDVLEAVNVPAHKIASSETTDLQFLHYVASKGKPIIISTGMCDMVDVEEAVNICLAAGNSQIMLMQCGAMYPLPIECANLKVIETYAKRFNCITGFSDHTLGQTTSTTAIGLGASIFEKHFTLDRNSEGPDHFYALEPDELKSYISGLHEAYKSLGSSIKEMLPKEKELGRREGLYLTRNMSKGEIITEADIAIKRPATGIRERYASVVIGMTTTKALEEGQSLKWEMVAFKNPN